MIGIVWAWAPKKKKRENHEMPVGAGILKF
jgi:hypothetical protein